jgi:hypothetical protein
MARGRNLLSAARVRVQMKRQQIAIRIFDVRLIEHRSPAGKLECVRITVRAIEDIALPIVGFMMRNHIGLDFAGTNTAREGFYVAPMLAGDINTVDFNFRLPELYPSALSFSPAIADGTLHSYRMCDWVDNAIVLQMEPCNGEVYGHIHLPCRVELMRSIVTRPPLLGRAEPTDG